jgi:hypothetical protein
MALTPLTASAIALLVWEAAPNLLALNGEEPPSEKLTFLCSLIEWVVKIVNLVLVGFVPARWCDCRSCIINVDTRAC